MSATSRRIGLRGLPERSAVVGKLAALARVASLGMCCSVVACGAGPEVSPWGALGRPNLSLYAERPDLDHWLATIDEETARSGLELSEERRAKDPATGAELVVRAYVGSDPIGRALHATRVVSPFGVVLAVGPLEPRDGADRAVEIVHAIDLGAGEVWRSLSDLEGDESLELLLRAPSGALELWSLGARGAAPLAHDLPCTPDRMLPLEPGVGLGCARAGLGRATKPELVEIATPRAGRLSRTTPEARAWHARQRDLRNTSFAASADASATLTRAIERCFHALAVGDARSSALAELSRADVGPALRGERDAYVDRFEQWFPTAERARER
jgi:hypothetical protein